MLRVLLMMAYAAQITRESNFYDGSNKSKSGILILVEYWIFLELVVIDGFL